LTPSAVRVTLGWPNELDEKAVRHFTGAVHVALAPLPRAIQFTAPIFGVADHTIVDQRAEEMTRAFVPVRVTLPFRKLAP
jgi:hypothetical protein